MDINRLKFFKKHPDWVKISFDEWKYRKFLLKWQYWVHQEQCKANPVIVAFRMNPPESHDAPIYGQFGSFGVFLGSEAKKESHWNYLPIEKFKAFLNEVKTINARLHLWGVEPFMHPDISQILRAIKERGILCHITTRGYLLEKYAEDIIKSEIKDIIISIDGPRSVYRGMNIRGNDYEALESGLRILSRLKKEKQTTFPVIRGSVLITAENYHYLNETLAAAQDMGIEMLTVNHTYFVAENIGQSHNRFFLDTFNSPADSWMRFRIDTGGIEVSALVREIMRLKGRSYSIPIDFCPSFRNWQISNYYKSSDFSIGKDRCMIPWFIFNVLENGNVVTCTDHPDLVIGNVGDDSILSIWNNEDMRHFRTELIRHGKFPVCSRCSGLYRT